MPALPGWPYAARAPADALRWAAAAAAAGVAVGAAATFDARLALLPALALGFAIALGRSATALLVVLAASVQIDAVDLAGVPISRLLAPVALVAIVGVLAAGRRGRPFAAPLVWAGAFAAWALLSAGWTVSADSTGFHLVSLAIALVYMLAFATVVRSRQAVAWFLAAFVLTAAAVGALAITGFLLGIPALLQDGRAAGGSGDPNFFAMYEVMAVPMTLALAAGARRGRPRRLLGIAVVVLVVGVFASVSRGGLLALLATAGLMFVLPARTLFGSSRDKAAVLTAVAGATLIAFVLAGGAVTQRVRTLETAGDTGSGRTALWSAAWTSIRERPLQGLGYGAFPATVNGLLRRTPGVDLSHFELRPGTGSEAHNVYISVLAELGLPGLLLFLGLVATTARTLWRTARRARSVGEDLIARAAAALLVALTGWAMASLFLTTDGSRALWVIVGLAAALPGLLRSPPARA